MVTGSDRLTPLDGLRGLAALGVAVFYHYGGFGGPIESLPLYGALPIRWLYHHGWLCVDLFFVLSGVVFTFKYREALAHGRVGGTLFFVLRLSRLYPLHLLTLLVLATMRWSRLGLGQGALIYPHNDGYHFALNLVMLHGGAFERGYSFNGPSWSIAVEFVLYGLFFALAVTTGRFYGVAASLAVVTGIVIFATRLDVPFANFSMARGLIGFFAGALLFLGMRRAAGHERLIGWSAVLLLALAFGLRHRGEALVSMLLWYGLVVFPLLVVTALTWRPLARVLALRGFTYLGDVSYSVYLVHAPVHLMLRSIAAALGVTLPSGNMLVLVLYGTSVLAVASLSHRYFEVPAQTWLRGCYRQRAERLSSPLQGVSPRDIRPAGTAGMTDRS